MIIIPVKKCSDKKWKIGEKGKCMYPSEAIAKKAYKGYLASKSKQKKDGW